MKLILAIAFGILVLGSDASEAEYIGDEGSEAILASGNIIDKFVLTNIEKQVFKAQYLVAFQSRIYLCNIMYVDARVAVMCYNSD